MPAPAPEKVNLSQKLALFDERWAPKLVGRVNEQALKLAKLEGAFVWHHHDDADELFLVVKGRLKMCFRDREVWLEEGDLIVVPRGTEHMPVADEEAHVLLIEPADLVNTGNVRDQRTHDTIESI
jgi:mannose-6-phosphate isomerase-like protein (cupin superfamily)